MSTIPAHATDQGQDVEITVNGVRHARTVPARMLLSDFLRHELRLTGTHVGCEHGVCGCCTVQIGGRAARSCLALAVQCDGLEVRTVEGLSAPDGELHPVQQAFHECHGLQCGFCTPGFLMAVEEYVREAPGPDLEDEEIREAISGNLCRCTGYANIVDAVRTAARLVHGGTPGKGT